tara:strand:- start:20297 stop:20431 length:135 start_codon:yes stop_codon:yes gene_type:complete
VAEKSKIAVKENFRFLPPVEMTKKGWEAEATCGYSKAELRNEVS